MYTVTVYFSTATTTERVFFPLVNAVVRRASKSIIHFNSPSGFGRSCAANDDLVGS